MPFLPLASVPLPDLLPIDGGEFELSQRINRCR